MKRNPIKDQSFELSIMAIKIYRKMKIQREYIISKQLLRSSTSNGANIHEACAAESKKDFIHKLSISLKEARETEYWIQLIDHSKIVTLNTEEFKVKLNAVVALLVSSIKTSKKNTNSPLY